MVFGLDPRTGPPFCVYISKIRFELRSCCTIDRPKPDPF